MKLHVGTSGYSYKEWKGSFYPEKLPAKEMLRYYGERFGTVEVNNTFYRIPKTAVVEGWASEVPADFKFVLKASQRITHILRLKEIDEPLSIFLRVASALQERLGPLLFQLPPNMKKDVDRLRSLLAQIPQDRRATLEFRHASWFDDEVFDLLREHQATLCIAEAEGDLAVPFVSTANWGYLRLRLPEYSDADLRSWLDRIRAQPWEEAYIFFKHEDEGTGPKFAKRLLELAA
jgi:uncharacterized protein YecE (DUF72 family)